MKKMKKTTMASIWETVTMKKIKMIPCSSKRMYVLVLSQAK